MSALKKGGTPFGRTLTWNAFVVSPATGLPSCPVTWSRTMNFRGLDAVPTMAYADVVGRLIVTVGVTQPRPTVTDPVWSTEVTTPTIRSRLSVRTVRAHVVPVAVALLV